MDSLQPAYLRSNAQGALRIFLKRSLFVFVGLILAGLQGCSTIGSSRLSKGPCSELNWYELGRGDGVRGQPSLGWESRVKSCRGFGDSEHRSYTNGWYAGVDAFCSESHGYVFGKTGQPYYDVCPRTSEGEFLTSYEKGLQVYLYEKSLYRWRKEIREKEELVNSLDEAQAKAKLLLDINVLEAEHVKNQKQRAQIESEMKTLLQ